jgi:hypothetical protein
VSNRIRWLRKQHKVLDFNYLFGLPDEDAKIYKIVHTDVLQYYDERYGWQDVPIYENKEQK